MANFLLYTTTVIVWGTSWIAVTFQLGEVPPGLSVAYRMFLSSAILYIYCRFSGRRIHFQLRDHAMIALHGALLFSINFFLIYQGTQYLASGLVSVIFSTVVFWNILGTAIVFRVPISARVIIGAGFGITGIIAVFWPELKAFDLSSDATTGLLLALSGTVCASSGMLASAKFQKRGLPLIETTALAMFYGACVMVALALLGGQPFVFEYSFAYVGSLLFLTVFASVVGFMCYLTLLGRIGADRAGYATVMFPVIALTLSTLYEGFEWTPLSLSGVALVLIGNVFVLLKPKVTSSKEV